MSTNFLFQKFYTSFAASRDHETTWWRPKSGKRGERETEEMQRNRGNRGYIWGGGMHMGPMCGDRGLVACQAVFVLSLFFFYLLSVLQNLLFFFLLLSSVRAEGLAVPP